MAHLRNLDRKCDACRFARAVVELYSNQNAHLGNFCRSCGARRFQEQQVSEREEWQRDQEAEQEA